MAQVELEGLLARAARSLEPELRSRLAEAVLLESARAGYDPLFVLALVSVESRFRLTVSSDRGASGLMQLKPSTFAWISAREPDAGGEDSATGEELRSADLRLHPEAERALAAQHGTPESAELGLGLRRALPDETVDELTRRLSSDPSTPTRAEVAELLSAVARYNDGHTPPMLVSTAS